MLINQELFNGLCKAIDNENECDECKLLTVKMYVAAIISDHYTSTQEKERQETNVEG